MTAPEQRSWFDNDDADGVAVAAITDDLHLAISPLGMITITDWERSCVQLDFDDAVDVVAALAEAVTILRRRGHRSGYPEH